MIPWANLVTKASPMVIFMCYLDNFLALKLKDNNCHPSKINSNVEPENA